MISCIIFFTTAFFLLLPFLHVTPVFFTTTVINTKSNKYGEEKKGHNIIQIYTKMG